MGVLDLEPTDTILEKESESAIIYVHKTCDYSFPVAALRTGTHRNVLQRGPGPSPTTTS